MEGFESFIGVNPWTALFVLLNTLLLFAVLKKFLFVPVKNMIDSRQAEIDSMYDEAEKAKQEAAALQQSYEQKLSAAQATSDRMMKDATARSKEREEEILRKANEQAAAILDKAQKDIAMEKKKALNEAKDEISGIAMAIAGKVVDRQLTEEDHSRLIDGFIDGLGE